MKKYEVAMSVKDDNGGDNRETIIETDSLDEAYEVYNANKKDIGTVINNRYQETLEIIKRSENGNQVYAKIFCIKLLTSVLG